MLYDGHVNCGADILSEDTSDKRDKYKGYEEIANDEDLQGDTTESSQNSDPDVLDDYYLELKALTEATYNEETKKKMAKLATECAGVCPIEECDTETGTVF
mgnify:CR=1 FL=1